MEDLLIKPGIYSCTGKCIHYNYKGLPILEFQINNTERKIFISLHPVKKEYYKQLVHDYQLERLENFVGHTNVYIEISQKEVNGFVINNGHICTQAEMI